MTYQIVCLSCGYHRAWPMLLDALADGHRHHDAPCAPGQPDNGHLPCRDLRAESRPR
jgi:hypothetical protein